MNKKAETLNELAKELLEAAGEPIDPITLDWLQRLVKLEDQKVDPDAERSVSGTINSDNSVSAEHRSINYLLKLNFGDWTELYQNTALVAAAVLPLESRLRLSIVIAGLVGFLYKKSGRELHSSDVEVLFAMHSMDKRTIAKTEIAPAYEARFEKQLKESHLLSSLDVLSSKEIIKHLGDGKYRIIEVVRFDRDR